MEKNKKEEATEKPSLAPQVHKKEESENATTTPLKEYYDVALERAKKIREKYSGLPVEKIKKSES